MNRQPTLTGPTLLLRPLAADDWDALFAIAADRQVWALHPAHDRWQEPVFRAFFADALERGGALVAIDRASGAVIGSSQFGPVADGAVEIGWTFLAPAQWGSGANREMKALMLGHALAELGRVDFRVGTGNLRSRRALEKIGAQDRGRTELAQTVSGPVVHHIYEVTRADFAAGPLAG